MTFVPPTGNFPPPKPTTVTKTIPSYLYVQYNDDEDLQAFVDWTNGKFQDYVGWFATIGLPAYAGDNAIVGELLDWVGSGLYGYPRPFLPSGKNNDQGPLNTYSGNEFQPNEYVIGSDQTIYDTTDDIYKRCLTWHTWTGDGKVFSLKWLKRRVMRFLTGANGTAGITDDTSIVSITFVTGVVTINIGAGTVTVLGGAFPNALSGNEQYPNELDKTFAPGPFVPFARIFKAAVDAGVLELPFQFTYNVITS